MKLSTKNLLIRLITFINPLTFWLQRSKLHRKGVIRFLLFVSTAPIIGFIHRPFVKQSFRKQISTQIQIQQESMKQSLQNLKIQGLKDNNFQYMIIVRSTQANLEQQKLYKKQKQLFQLNNQIVNKLQSNENYFQGIKFLFLGQGNVYQGLSKNLKQQQNQFQFLPKKPSIIQQQDKIFLMTIQQNGDQKIVMQWDINANLKSIIRQISKLKHKKFVQSMNF